MDGIYAVDADGGTPQLILAARSHSWVYNPAFSPDGTQIAYLDLPWAGDPLNAGLSLRIVNADGTGVRVIHEKGHPQSLSGPAWSPDGTHIAYSGDNSMWVVSADGSGVSRMPDGHNPCWSPNGSRIAFELSHEGLLAIVDADGTHLRKFRNRTHAGPWTPLLSAVPGEPNSTTTTGEVSPVVYAIVALEGVGVLFLTWRAKRRTRQVTRR